MRMKKSGGVDHLARKGVNKWKRGIINFVEKQKKASTAGLPGQSQKGEINNASCRDGRGKTY